MRITLEQADINQAMIDYAEKMGIKTHGKKVEVLIKTVRLPVPGHHAELVITREELNTSPVLEEDPSSVEYFDEQTEEVEEQEVPEPSDTTPVLNLSL